MAKLGISLCMLAHNRVAEAANLISSLRGFRNIELEVCIADQESETEARRFFQKTADSFAEVSDHDLWHKGFGWAKHQAVALASNNWVVIGDPGEVWHETTAHGECCRLASAIKQINSVPAFRVYYGRPPAVRKVLAGKSGVRNMSDDLGRVYDKRHMRLLGYIHEAPCHANTGKLWAEWARRQKAVALIEHEPKPADPVYVKRKQILYDHLIHMIVENPKLRRGTDFRWWTAHWKNVVEPRFNKNITFEQWKALGG